MKEIFAEEEKKVLNEMFNLWKDMYKNDDYQPLYVTFYLSQRPFADKEMLFKARLNGKEVGAKVIFDKASKLNDKSKEAFKNVELGKKYKIDDLDLEV